MFSHFEFFEGREKRTNVLPSMRCIDNSDFMAHVLPIFLHFDIIYLTFATDFWHMLLGSLVFFHHLFCGAPRNPQGNFVQRLGAPSPPEVQLLRQVRWKSHGKKIPQNKNTTVFPAAHPTPELCFLKWHFLGGMPRRFEDSESFGSGFPSPTASGKVYHTVDGSEILHLLIGRLSHYF